MDRKRDDGASEGDHLRSAQRQIEKLPGWKGKKAEEIVPQSPPFPGDLEYLYGHFGEIIIGTASNGMGPLQITWETIRAYRVEMRVDLEPWESLALVRMGHARAVIESERAAKEAKQKKPNG